jgi:hypothetical protein
MRDTLRRNEQARVPEMKIVVRFIGGLLALALTVFVAQSVASETGEVVVLHTLDAGGVDRTTRIWIVDHAGQQWLRSGSSESVWYRRLIAQPHVRIERAGKSADYVATPSPENRQTINDQMRAKYGWRDALISWMVGGRDGAVPIILNPSS